MLSTLVNINHQLFTIQTIIQNYVLMCVLGLISVGFNGVVLVPSLLDNISPTHSQ